MPNKELPWEVRGLVLNCFRELSAPIKGGVGLHATLEEYLMKAYEIGKEHTKNNIEHVHHHTNSERKCAEGV